MPAHTDGNIASNHAPIRVETSPLAFGMPFSNPDASGAQSVASSTTTGVVATIAAVVVAPFWHMPDRK